MSSSGHTFDTHAALYVAYLDELIKSLPEVIDWWESLVQRDGMGVVARRWPARAAAHPRIIAVYRRHYLECETLNDHLEAPPIAKDSFDDETAWGVEDEDDRNDGRVWIHPASLLLEDLESESEDLFDFMNHLVMSPVGSHVAPNLDHQISPSAAPRMFTAPNRHDVAVGIGRLLGAPRDLARESEWRTRDPEIVGSDHRRLFVAYRVDLERALAGAERWWLGIIEQREREGRSREQAVDAAFDLVFCGAVAYPDVVGVIRAYWLACEAINAELPPTAWVAPERMLLAWLLDGQHDSWVRILTGMPYWPLGLDEHGAWV